MRRLLLACALLVAVRAQGQTVDMDIQPATATMNVGQTITLAVRAIAGVNEVDTVEADLNFDATVFQVTSITPRPVMGGGGASSIDNVNGFANMSYATTAAFQTGTFFVADVAFQAIAASGGSVISFNTAFPRISQASRTGVGYTGTFTSAVVTVIVPTPTQTPGASATPTLTSVPTPRATLPGGSCPYPFATPWPTP